jgi:L,D-transpeptidase catalytic domain
MVRVREFAGVAGFAFVAMTAAATLGTNRLPSFLDRNQVIALNAFVVRPQPARVAAAAPRIALPAKLSAKAATPTVIARTPAIAAPKPVAPRLTERLVATKPMFVAVPVLAPRLAEIPPAPAGSASSGGDTLANAVALRVRDSVPPELFRYFDVYLYVSKAADGAWAQHMFIFHKGPDGRLVFEQSVPVSTGRERQEKYFTSTPTGLFELDPNRFDRHHRSHRWNNAPMPWAMFLNYTIHGRLTGVALHSGIGHVDHLGHRASGGCVRLPPQTAEMLFKRFQAEEYGDVPVFAFDDARDSTRTDGTLARGADGEPLMTQGYKVLVIIQDYPGGPAEVAVLS